MNWNESGLHRAMGWGAGMTGLAWLLSRREIKQFPPENNKNPVVWIEMNSSGDGVLDCTDDEDLAEHWRLAGKAMKPYWSATRTRDSFKDLHDMCIGLSIASPCLLGVGVLIGWLVF